MIVPPKCSSFGLMPLEQEERTHWFQSEDPFVTSRIYLRSQKVRFELYNSYFGRNHYVLSQRNRFGMPPVIVWDRGPLSARAFAYACLRIGTGLSDEWIMKYINLHFPKITYPFSFTVVFNPQSREDIMRLAQRLDPNENFDTELSLIEGQSNYISQQKPFQKESILIDPFDDLTQIHEKVAHEITQRLTIKHQQNELTVKEVGCPTNRLFLNTLLSRLSSLKFIGQVTILGGVIEKGYSDNDIDILVEYPSDIEQIKKACGNYAPFVHLKNPRESDIKELANPWKMEIGISQNSF